MVYLDLKFKTSLEVKQAIHLNLALWESLEGNKLNSLIKNKTSLSLGLNRKKIYQRKFNLKIIQKAV